MIDACETDLKASHCDELGKQSDGTYDEEIRKKIKSCEPAVLGRNSVKSMADIVRSCRAGAGDAWDYLTVWDDFQTWVNKAYDATVEYGKSVPSRIAKTNKELRGCDIACKRRHARDFPEYQKMTDAELEKVSAVTIEHRASYREAMLQQLEQANRALKFDPLRDPRVLAAQAQRDKEADTTTKAASIYQTGRAAAETAFQKLQCYSAEVQAEMTCYGIFLVLDPTIAFGLALKSPILFKLLAKSASGVNVAASSLTTVRDAFVSKNLGKQVTTAQQNAKWLKIAETTAAGEGVLFLEVENSSLKKLNDSTKDKNLITSFNNLNNEILFKNVDDVMAFYSNKVEIIPGSNFKSGKFAFRPKPPYKELPPEFEKDLQKAVIQANKEFQAQLQVNGLAKPGDGVENWFRAGIGETSDEANFAARSARDMSGKNQPRRFDDPAIQENMGTYVKWSEGYRSELAKNLEGTGLLEKTATGKPIPREEVFDIIRKSGDVEEVQQRLVRKFGGTSADSQAKLLKTLDEKTVQRLKDYTDMVDQFTPSNFVVERKIASLEKADKGGLTADFSGMGAKNLKATATALADSSSLRDALLQARKEEKALTASFEKSKADFDKVVSKYMKNSVDSGDDFAAAAKRPLNPETKQKLLDEVAQLGDPSGQRLSFIGSDVVKADRNKLAAHGEYIEKILRKNLEGVLPEDKLRQVTFGVDMQGQKAGQGSVDLILGEGKKANLSSSERERIQKEFREAVEKFNKAPDDDPVLKAYQASARR